MADAVASLGTTPAADLADPRLLFLLSLSLAVVSVLYQQNVPSLAPVIVDVGTDDEQYIGPGFYAAEQAGPTSTYRWTTNKAYVHLPERGRQPQRLSIGIHGSRPPDQPGPQVTVSANGQFLVHLTTDRGHPQVYEFTYHPPRLATSNDLILEIRSETFVPGQKRGKEDVRVLGVIVDWIKAEPLAKQFPLDISIPVATVLVWSVGVGTAYAFIRRVSGSPRLGLWIAALLLCVLGATIALFPLQTEKEKWQVTGRLFAVYAIVFWLWPFVWKASRGPVAISVRQTTVEIDLRPWIAFFRADVSRVFIAIFVILLVCDAFLVITMQDQTADEVANWAYLALVTGVVMRAWRMIKSEHQRHQK